MRILIAEDSLPSRLLLENTLQKLGHEVVAAKDGAEAWCIFQKEEFTLLISDWVMPDVDGLELCRRVRAANSLSYTYIILLTSLSGKENYLEAMKAGADDFITKPFEADQLATRLHVAQRILQEMARRQQAEEAYARLAFFPEIDPNPIIEIDPEGALKYLNPAASRAFPELWEQGVDHPLLAGWKAWLQEVETTAANSLICEVGIGGTWHQQVITHMPQSQRVRLHIFDITGRKRAEEELRVMARQLKAAAQAHQRIMDYSLDVICTIDEAGRFIQVSPACETVWGYTPAELAGQEYIALVHPDDVPQTNQAARDITSGTAATNFENRYIRKDGVPVPMIWSAFWSQADQIMFCVARDNTERKQAEVAIRYAVQEAEQAKEEAEAASHAKSEFLSRMSHELRTPLNAILGFGQLLEMDDLKPHQRDAVGHILKGGEHLLELINEVLDIASIEAGRLALSAEPVRVEEVLRESMDLVRPLAAPRRVRLHHTVTGDRYVLADRQRLKQVLLNLLSNAVKYNRDGGMVTVSCEDIVHRDDPSAGSGQAFSRLAQATGVAIPNRLRVAIHDTGPGIAPENLQHLFTPFERLGAEHSAIEGTGIGLALSKRLMELMEGSITVESTVGVGSTFAVELPCATDPVEALADLDESAPDATAETADAAQTLLYIEDNLPNLRLIEQILLRRPHIKLVSAMQGSIGLDLARRHRPNLILLDLHLPDMNGDEVLQHLRADALTRGVPVVIISADATPRQIERLREAGAVDYLTKPLDVKRFLAVLDENLQMRLKPGHDDS